MVFTTKWPGNYGRNVLPVNQTNSTQGFSMQWFYKPTALIRKQNAFVKKYFWQKPGNNQNTYCIKARIHHWYTYSTNFRTRWLQLAIELTFGLRLNSRPLHNNWHVSDDGKTVSITSKKHQMHGLLPNGTGTEPVHSLKTTRQLYSCCKGHICITWKATRFCKITAAFKRPQQILGCRLTY